MNDLLFDDILKQREERNERIVAYARLFFVLVPGILDFLAYLQVIQFTAIDPDRMTLFIDAMFISFSALVLFVVTKSSYNPNLKFLTITMDYCFVGVMITFDPTIPRDANNVNWIAMIATLFIFMYNLIRFSKMATLYSASLSIIFFFSLVHFSNTGINGDTYPILMGLVMFLMIGYYITRTNAEMMQEANTKKMMERFLPPQLVDELYKHQNNLNPAGNHQKVTILFSDIRSFTAISETMHPTNVVSLLNDYLSLMTEIIFKYEGTIDKFIGDAIMTIYGAPIRNNNDEMRAIHTALEMVQALPSISSKHPELKEPLEIGIGIHTGDVIIGNIGSRKRLDYTAIGDNVNLASRIESLTKFYKCKIIISETTLQAIEPMDDYKSLIIREIDTVLVKGRTTSITLFEIMGFQNDIHSKKANATKETFGVALTLFKQKKFEAALKHFEALSDDNVSNIYKNRCLEYIDNPPPETWNGIHTMTEK